MHRTALFLAFFSLASPAVFADQPNGIPKGAIPIDNPSEAAKAFRQESETGVRLSEADHSPRQRTTFSASARTSEPGKTMKKVDAPAIKVRAVVAAPES